MAIHVWPPEELLSWRYYRAGPMAAPWTCSECGGTIPEGETFITARYRGVLSSRFLCLPCGRSIVGTV